MSRKMQLTKLTQDRQTEERSISSQGGHKASKWLAVLPTGLPKMPTDSTNKVPPGRKAGDAAGLRQRAQNPDAERAAQGCKAAAVQRGEETRVDTGCEGPQGPSRTSVLQPGQLEPTTPLHRKDSRRLPPE